MGENADRITIDPSHGDSSWVGTMPGFLRGPARKLDSTGGRNRDRRMVRTVQMLYPTLCRVEREKHGTTADGAPARLRLDGVPFDRAVNDARAIERGLAVFDQAWTSGAIALRAANGKLIPPTKGKAVVPACGYSVDHVKRYFIDRAARIILRRMPDIYDLVAGELQDPALLPRLRRIASIPPAAISEIVRGFDGQVRKALLDTDDATLEAMARIHPRVLKALRTALGPDFSRLMAAGPDYLSAVGEALTVPEQASDLGKSLLLLQTPEAVRAIGAWDIHDVTEEVNAERKKKGMPALRVPTYKTDIRALQGVLGPEFDHLLEFPPVLLDVFGQGARELRALDVAPRTARVEQMTFFCQRYMSYLSEASVTALFLLKPHDRAKVPDGLEPNIAEVFFILEGLWGKKGYGRKFFEETIGTEEGARAIALMMHDFVGLKQRGSIKTASDLTQIVGNSDLLDSHILKYMAKK
ncbi:hypothetical protein [Roseospira navarrensis]|uniref:Uncharacterized protein n=1 Tax=Roseospira navarrensis TaxID=140058 RepID=A0A7X2D2L5_9PROT|nr:hypothetical protein [Roseospira navarrensis]MQX35903.1 hypothetical protein [Roseospira navarrensis]